MNNKCFKIICSLFLASFLIASCGSSNDDDKKNGNGDKDKFKKEEFKNFEGLYKPTDITKVKLDVNGMDVTTDLTKSVDADVRLTATDDGVKVKFEFYRKDVSSDHKDWQWFRYTADITPDKKSADVFEAVNLGLDKNKLLRETAYDKEIVKNFNEEMPNFIKEVLLQVLIKANQKDFIKADDKGIIKVTSGAETAIFPSITKVGYKLEFVKSDVAAKKTPEGVTKGKQAKVYKDGSKYKVLARIPFDVTITLKSKTGSSGTDVAAQAISKIFDGKKFRVYVDFDGTKE